MDAEEIRDYAATLLLDHARNVEYLTIFEMAEDHVDGGEISEEDARKVSDAVNEAKIVVSFPSAPLFEYVSPVEDDEPEVEEES